MKVLEEFWYGNINPMERPFQSQREFDKVFRLLTKNEEELLKNLNEQEKELYEELKDAFYAPSIYDVSIQALARAGFVINPEYTFGCLWEDCNRAFTVQNGGFFYFLAFYRYIMDISVCFFTFEQLEFLTNYYTITKWIHYRN